MINTQNRIDKLCRLLKKEEAVYVTSRANIFYFSGFTSEDASLLISANDCILITDSRYTTQAKLQTSGFQIYNIKDGLDNAFKLIKADRIGYEEEYMTVKKFKEVKKLNPNVDFVGMQKTISQLREEKDEYEIGCIREAERLGDAAFSHILKVIKVGSTEQEIAMELEFFMRKNGAEKLSFETITASGLRSSMPHGIASAKVIEQGDMLTLDFGCVLDGYCSDMTRTVVVGHASDYQREIYDIVLNAQLAAIDAICVGKRCSDIDMIARDYIVQAGYGDNFGHGLGHSVGIEIHESPSFSPRCDTIIQNGHVITVEPGIYLKEFGVRIEDVVAVHNGAIENLTTSPKKLIEIK